MNTRKPALLAALALLATLFTAAPLPAPAAVPTAQWTFDDGSGTLATDNFGSNPLTLHGAATWATGLVGTHALSLNGRPGVDAEAARPAVNTLQSYTVMAWVNVRRIGGYQTFVSIDGTQISGFFLQLRSDGTFGFTVLPADAPSADGVVAGATDPAEANTWYHLAGVHDAAAHTLTLYVNGVAQQSMPFDTPWRAAGPTAIGRGKYSGAPADWANALIDDVRMYQAALSPGDIRAIAQASLPTGTTVGPPPPALLQINAAVPGPPLNPLMYGLMTEEINHAYDGGLYAELIQNRAFKDDPATPVHWSLVIGGAGQVGSGGDGGLGPGTVALDPTQPLNAALPVSLKLTSTGASNTLRVGAANDGYWGIPVEPNTSYHASFYAKASPGFSGPLTLDIESTNGATVYATATIAKVTGDWKQYTATLTTGKVAPSTANRFVIAANKPGAVWLDLVSLFPPTYNNRPNGLRPDLMQKQAELTPAFLRLPGGNYLEGDTIANRFDWKKTIGSLDQRPGHLGPWDYRSTDGLGLLEYLEWCQDLHMEPLLAVYAGYSLNRYKNPNPERITPGPALQSYVQDALDEIEYVTGGTKTKWGAQRARDGHPAPFPLHYVEIGNEDGFDKSGSYDARFAQFYDAIKATYPQLKVIATAGGKDDVGKRTPVTTRTPDLIDEHYYESPRQFEDDTHHYDAYDRKGPKIFVGEWASQLASFSAKGGPSTPNLDCALGDAAWMTGMERNADIVLLESYAPMLVNVNPGARQWKTNLIGYDALSSYGSPSYYVQVLFDRYHGDVVLPATLTGPPRLAESVTRDTKSGTTYIKLVNPSSYPQPIHVTLAGVGSVAAGGTVTTLSGVTLQDTNSLTEPTKIVPVTAPLSGLSSSFDYRLLPYSVTVLQMQAK